MTTMAKLDLDATKIKAYDSVTGDDMAGSLISRLTERSTAS